MAENGGATRVGDPISRHLAAGSSALRDVLSGEMCAGMRGNGWRQADQKVGLYESVTRPGEADLEVGLLS